VVELDPYDHKERIYLNFGHTFGHAIEAYKNYQIKHGIAISYGMLLALEIGIQKGITPKSLYQEVFHLLKHRGLIDGPLFEKNALMPFIKFDKKQQAEGLKFVLIKMIGTPLVVHIKEGELSCIS
jgi:3-dehydroquinate synthase